MISESMNAKPSTPSIFPAQGLMGGSARCCSAFVTGMDARKVGIVQSVIGHLGIKAGKRSSADIVVVVDGSEETIKNYRADLGAGCWILGLTERGSAVGYLAAGASDVLTGGWSVNDLCDRIDVALSRMVAVADREVSNVAQPHPELAMRYSRSEANGMVEWMLRGAEDTITRMTLAHAMVEKKCAGVVMAEDAVEDLRAMMGEIAAAVRVEPNLTSSCDCWSVLAGGLGLPLLGEGRRMVTDSPDRLPLLRGSRHALEQALRSLVMPLVRESCDEPIAASVTLNEEGDASCIGIRFGVREALVDGEAVSVFNDGAERYGRTTDRLLAVAAAKISSLGGELLSAPDAGYFELRLPVVSGAPALASEDAPESMRIVLVEPDAALRGVLEQYFSMQNVHTLSLQSLEQVEQLIQRARGTSYPPDLFVVALQTAGGVLDYPPLRAMSQLASVLVTISGDADEAVLVRRMEGVADVLRKPYTAGVLLSRAMELALSRV